MKIFGVERERRADVVVLNGFSAHADQNDLLAFVDAVGKRGALRDVFLVHGEPPAQEALRTLLVSRGLTSVRVPGPGDVIRV